MLQRWKGDVGASAVLAVAWWVIDKVGSDLAPTLPRTTAYMVLGGAAAVWIAFRAGRVWGELRRRSPGPWLADPVWRSLTWLRRRPVLSVIMAAPQVEFDGPSVVGCRLLVTVSRNAARAKADVVVDFDEALVTLSQKIDGKGRRWRLAPVETGGFLARSMPAGRSNAVQLAFAVTRLPLASRDAPDFTRPYQFVLSGVRAVLSPPGAMQGRLPDLIWRWEETPGLAGASMPWGGLR